MVFFFYLVGLVVLGVTFFLLLSRPPVPSLEKSSHSRVPNFHHTAGSVGRPVVACSVERPAVACSVECPALACSVGRPAVACSVGRPAVACSVGRPVHSIRYRVLSPPS